MRHKQIRALIIALSVFVLIALMAPSVGAQEQEEEPVQIVPQALGSEITVMTRNVYLGADLGPVLEAFQTGDPDLIAIAIGEFAAAAEESDIPGRAWTIAEEIASNQPDLVGIQEATIWTTPEGSVDFIFLLRKFLALQGQQYKIVVRAEGFDEEFLGIRLQISDVILAKTYPETNWLRLTNPSSGQYQAKVSFPSPFGGDIEIPRQWASVDVRVRRHSFRFITTHLESLGPPYIPYNVRFYQAQELLQGPARTSRPVILVGDFNSELNTRYDAAFLFRYFGFKDSWSSAHPNDPGYTCCHPSDLSDPTSELEKQIDFIMTRGVFKVLQVEIVGEESEDMTDSGKWPSDHAGVVSTMRVPYFSSVPWDDIGPISIREQAN